MAFSPDGDTLYVGGFDKVVRVWKRRDGRFELVQTIHVPIGPGTGGTVNAVAVSDDGKWLGNGRTGTDARRDRLPADGRDSGSEPPSPQKSWRTPGAIYVVPIDRPANGKVLRGHRERCVPWPSALQARAWSEPPLLVSGATPEPHGDASLTAACTCGTSRPARWWPVCNDLPERVEPPPGLAVLVHRHQAGGGARRHRLAAG